MSKARKPAERLLVQLTRDQLLQIMGVLTNAVYTRSIDKPAKVRLAQETMIVLVKALSQLPH